VPGSETVGKPLPDVSGFQGGTSQAEEGDSLEGCTPDDNAVGAAWLPCSRAFGSPDGLQARKAGSSIR
jgi:hypothetical protein